MGILMSHSGNRGPMLDDPESVSLKSLGELPILPRQEYTRIIYATVR